MTINLDELKDGILNLHPSVTNLYGLSAVYIFERNKAESGIVMNIIGNIEGKESTNTISINWTVYQINDSAKRSLEPKTAVDNSAVGITLLLIKKYTEYEFANISYIDGNGFDYWVSKNSANILFDNAMRLEISGIEKENKYNTIQKRARDKERRFENNKSGIKEAIISVIEFSIPKSKFYTYKNGK